MKSGPLLSLFLVWSATLSCVSAATASPQPPPVTEAPTVTATATQAPTTTSTRMATTIPTMPPTATLTITLIPTSTGTPTNTPLPPLPDFSEALSFGGGGGCGRCGVGYCYENQNPALSASVFGTSIKEWNDPSERSGYLCLYGVTPDLPFTVRLVSPDGRIVLRSDFIYHSGEFSWDGYSVQGYVVPATTQGLINAELEIFWPVGFPLGIWQIYSEGAGLQAQGNFDATRVIGDQVNRVQEVSISEPLAQSKVLPAYQGFVPDANTGTLDIDGAGFMPNSSVYVLVYQRTDRVTGLSGITWDLKNKQRVNANEHGWISAKIPGPFFAGQTYMLVSVTKPENLLVSVNSVLSLNYNDDSIGYQVFQVKQSTSPQPVSSCPGAPPQRMLLNQPGSVCTRSETVRLRDAPARSANTIMFLPTGTRFTVVAGPTCADQWSWWQIQTDNGYSGWISEGGDAADPYFICPAP